MSNRGSRFLVLVFASMVLVSLGWFSHNAFAENTITLNNVQSTSGTTDSSNQIMLSNFNAAAGADRLLVVGVSANNNNVGSITFAGVPLAREVSHFTNNDAEFWYLVNPAGTGDIIVTMNGPTQAVVGAYSFSGVNQTVPMPAHITRHNLSPSSPAISITTQYPNDWVLDLPSIWGGVTLGSPTCTQQWSVNVPGQITGASSSTVAPSPANVTCSWTASSDNMWDDAAVEIKASATGAPATTVPQPPTGLKASGGNAQVSLSWSAPSSNGGSPVTGYKIYRSTSSGTETVLAQAGNVTSYSDTGVTNGQAYFYKVTALSSAGESPASNEASATPTSTATVPSAPLSLSATAASSSQINLSWSAPASSGGSAITGYKVERSLDGGSTWSTIAVLSTTTYSDTGLSPGTTYTYRVSATNSAGTGPPSNTASAATQAAGGTSIALNNVQSTSGVATLSSSDQVTLSNFNAGTGSNRLLVVGVSANAHDAVSVTFGGVQLARIAHSFVNNDAEFWYVTNPSGTGDIVVTFSGATHAVVGAYSFSGVDQTSPIPTHTTSRDTASSPSVSITTTSPNSWVLDLPSIYGSSTLGLPTCAQQWDTNMPGFITGASSSVMVPTPGTVTCSWTASSGEQWDDAAIEIQPAGSGSTSTSGSGGTNPTSGSGGSTSSTGITVFAHRIPAYYWDPCFALTCDQGTGPGVTMWIALYDSTGNFIEGGFTDENGYTFANLDPSETYYVYPTNCENCHGAPHTVAFQYWGDDYSSQRPRAATVGDSLDAWYSCTNGCAGGP